MDTSSKNLRRELLQLISARKFLCMEERGRFEGRSEIADVRGACGPASPVCAQHVLEPRASSHYPPHHPPPQGPTGNRKSAFQKWLQKTK